MITLWLAFFIIFLGVWPTFLLDRLIIEPYGLSPRPVVECVAVIVGKRCLADTLDNTRLGSILRHNYHSQSHNHCNFTTAIVQLHSF